MKKVVYFLIAIIFVSCSSSGPEVTKDDESVKKKRKAVREKTDVMMDELNEESGEKKDNLIAQKPTAKDINPRSEPNIQIPDSARKIESEIKRNKDNYYYGENEGDDYETVKEKSKTELIENIKQFITSTRVRETSDINDSISDIFKISSSSFSMMKLYNLKSIDVKPKTGGKYRVISYISAEDLLKSDEDLGKEITGLLKEAENTELLEENIYNVIPHYYRAFLKSQTSINEIKYNSTSLGELSAKSFAEQKIRKYIEDIKINIASIIYSESDEHFEITLKLIYQNKIINNIKVKNENSSFRTVKNSTVKLYETFIDLSHRIINIDCQVSPFIEFAQSDYIKNIEEDFGFTVTKTVEIDFSSFISIDFDGKMENEKVYRFTPKIKFISTSEFSWEFSDGTKSSDERPLKILQPNFKDLTVTLILNNNNDFTVVKKLQKDKTLITIKKPIFTSKYNTGKTENKRSSSSPTTETAATSPGSSVTDNKLSATITPNSTPVSITNIYKTNLEFENELNTATSGNEIEQILEDLKDKQFLKYSKNSRSISNIEPCYLFVLDKFSKYHFLKPGTQIRLSLRGKEINMNDISKILYYIILN